MPQHTTLAYDRIQIEGVAYLSTKEVLRQVGVVRQTLWRWRREQKVPAGRRYRDHQILFTQEEAEAIRQYADRIQPNELPQASVSKDVHQQAPDAERGAGRRQRRSGR